MIGPERSLSVQKTRKKLGWGLRNLCQDLLSDTKLIVNSAVLGENTLEPEPMKPDLGYCPSEEGKSNIFCCLDKAQESVTKLWHGSWTAHSHFDGYTLSSNES